jgi:magnesium-transporting ATPase (P-type)
LSLAYHLGTAFALQLVLFIDVKKQHWYRFLATSEESEKNQSSMEATILWSLMFYQVLGVAFAYSISRPFKKPLITNFIYVVVLCILTAWCTYVTIIPDWWHIKILKFVEIPILYRVRVFGIAMVYFLSSFLFERCVISGSLRPLTRFFSPRRWKMWIAICMRKRPMSHRAHKNLAASVMRLRKAGAMNRIGMSKKQLYGTSDGYSRM